MATAGVDNLIVNDDKNSKLAEAIAEQILTEKGTIPQQVGFGDIYKSFKNEGFLKGLTKTGEYLNSPEGLQIIGGLYSNSKPYAGASMVDRGRALQDAQRQMQLQQNAPLSKGEKLNAALALLKMQPEKTNAIVNALKAGSEIKSNEVQAAKMKEETENISKEREIKEKILTLDTEKLDYEKAKEARINNLKIAEDMFNKGTLSPENYQKYATNPEAYDIVGGGSGILGVGKKASLKPKPEKGDTSNVSWRVIEK